MLKKGICPICNRGPRNLTSRHPETRKHICSTCYRKATGKRNPVKRGICPKCKKGPRAVNYLHPKTRQNICYNCYSKIKHRERGLLRVPKKSKKPVVTKRLKRENPYPTRKSVVEALEVRTREDAKKPGRKAKYLNKEAVIAVLEDREIQEEENFPSVLQTTLYHSALRFSIELPIKKNHPVRYYSGDLVKNQNPKDPDICGMVGKVLDSSKKEVRVDFRERGGVTRVYRKWVNLNNITLHARNSLTPVETAKREVVLV